MPPLNSIIAALNGVSEFIAVLLVAEAFTGKKKNNLLYMLAVCQAVFCIVLTNCFSASELLMVVCYLVCFIYVAWLSSFKLKQALKYAMSAFGCVCILEMVLCFINTIISSMVNRVIPYQAVTFLSVSEMLLLCIFFRNTFFVIETRKILNDAGQSVYFLSAIGCIMFLSAFINFKLTKEMPFYDSIYLVTGTIVLLFSVYKIYFYQQELKLKSGYAEVYKGLITQIRERQHKFVNQINAIYSMINIYDNYEDLIQKQREELGNLEQYILPGKLFVLDNPLVIAHIHQKMCEALEKDIKIETKFDCSLRNVHIPDTLLIEILGNLLDNAIDEVLERKRNEKIYLHIIQKNGNKYIQVANEHEHIPFEEYKRFFEYGYSTKGSDRGCGLAYLRKIARKYNAGIQVGNELFHGCNCFFIRVVL